VGKVYPDFPYFCRPVVIALPSQKVHAGVWHWGGKLWEQWLSQLVVLVLLLQPIDAAHGGIYGGSKRKCSYEFGYGMLSTMPFWS